MVNLQNFVNFSVPHSSGIPLKTERKRSEKYRFIKHRIVTDQSRDHTVKRRCDNYGYRYRIVTVMRYRPESIERRAPRHTSS